MGRPRKNPIEQPSPEEKPAAVAPQYQPDPLIKTLAEVEAMTPEEKAAFRHAGGTTINNPN